MKRTVHNMNTRGFTMIEMIAVFVVIGIILSAVIPALIGATNQSRIASAVGTIRNLQTAAANYYQGNGGSYSNMSLTTLASGGYLPANFTSGTNQDAWGGTITVTGPDAGNSNWFDIAFTNVPSSAASALTTAVTKLSQNAPTYTATSQTWTAAF